MIAAALLQLTAVAAITVAIYLLARSGYLEPAWPFALCDGGSSCHGASLLVRLAYLLTALGIALTNNRLTARASEWIRKTSPVTHTNKPEHSTKAMMVQLWIVAIVSVAEELDTPAEFVVSLGLRIDGPWLGAILWPALWSVVIATIGILAYAATKAVPGGIIED